MDAFLAHAGFQSDRLRTRDGVRIAYWIAPPRAYHVKDEYQVRRKGKQASFSFNFSFDGDPTKAPLLLPKGSVVLLHPWSMSGAAMMMWGIHFAAAGYQVVMPDLRSQGSSSDAPVGYGPREAGDIVELVHDLQAKHHLPGPLYLLGASYGATVALFAAPQLENLRGVMALEPYANAAAVIRRAPASGLFGFDWLAHWIAQGNRRGDRTCRPETGCEPGADRSRRCAGPLPGLHADPARQPRRADFRQGGGRTESPIVAGELRGSPRRRHLSLPMRTAWLVPPLLGWMQALPDAGGQCPVFSLPAATQTAASPGSAGTAAEAQPRR